MKPTILVFVNLLFSYFAMAQNIDTTNFSKKYYHRKSVYEQMPDKKGEIVFLGNSITEQGTWSELFQNSHIINRGIGGDTSDGVLYRLDEVLSSKPDKIFLLIGTNDLKYNKTPTYIISKIGLIVGAIRKKSPETLIYLQSVLPTFNRPERPISAIKAINEGVEKIADGKKIFYVDLFPLFSNPNNGEQLYEKYSLDGLHLKGDAYLKWKKAIENLVNDNSHRLQKNIDRIKNPVNNYVMVAAHRGDWRNAPENSLLSIQNSAAMGVDIVEIDLQMTKDSVIVLMHDDTIDRTTTGTGRLKDHTWEEIQSFFLKDVLGRPTPYKIPTLEQAAEIAKNNIILDLDLKKTIPFGRVANILRKSNTVQQTIIRSYRSVQEAKAYYGPVLDSLIYMPGIEKEMDYVTYFKNWEKHKDPTFYVPKFETDTEPLVAFLNTITSEKNGLWIHSITANRSGGHHDELAITQPDNAWGWLVEKGVDIIQTDRPAALLAYLREKGWHD